VSDPDTYADPAAVDYLRPLVGHDLAVPVAEVVHDCGADYRDEEAVEEASPTDRGRR